MDAARKGKPLCLIDISIKVSSRDQRLIRTIYEALEPDSTDAKFPFTITVSEGDVRAAPLVRIVKTGVDSGDARAFTASVLRLLRAAVQTIWSAES